MKQLLVKLLAVVALVVAACFALSTLGAYLPAFSGIAEGTRTIIITVVVAAAAAVLFPHEDKEEAE